MASIGIEAAAQKLINPEGNDFDVGLLDDVVNAAYSPTDPNRAMANKALMALQETEHLWTKADTIMERAQNPQSRFFGLQVLDDAIRTRYVVFVSCCCQIFPPHPPIELTHFLFIYQVESSPDRAARGYQELCCRKSYSGVIGRDPSEWRAFFSVQVESYTRADPETGMASQLGFLHSGSRWEFEDERGFMREQHEYFEAPERRNLRLLP
jgi:hypothetical protein